MNEEVEEEVEESFEEENEDGSKRDKSLVGRGPYRILAASEIILHGGFHISGVLKFMAGPSIKMNE